MSVISTALGDIEIISWGSGDQSIILLHASATGPHAFAGLASCLKQPQRHLSAPAFVGYGATRLADTVPADHTAQNRAIANHALRRNDGRRRILFGHSMGGLIALLAAIDQADSGCPLDALILYEPILHDILDPSVNADAEALAWDSDIIAAMTKDVRAGQPAHGIRRFVEAWNEVAWDDLPQGARSNLVANADNLVRETTAMPAVRLATAQLQCLTTPTLLLRGERSPAFVQLIITHLAGVMPAARTVLLTGSGHMAPLIQPDAVAAAISTFLNGLWVD